MSESQDRIDTALAQWAAQNPEIDLSAPAITLRLVLLGKHIEQHAKRSFEPFGLQTWEFDVLAALRRQGAPYELAAGELARHVMLTCSGLTHRLDRLAERGLIERQSCPEDRRRVLVRLTSAGQELTDRAGAHRAAEAQRLVEVFDPAEREALTALLRKMLAAMDASIPPSCGGDAD